MTLKKFHPYIILSVIFLFIQGLKLQAAELKEWKAKKRWYENLDAIQDKKKQIKKMIRWAKVEISEKLAEAALAQLENLQEDIGKVFGKYKK